MDGGARKFLSQPPPLHQQSQIGSVHQLLAGGIAGAFSKTFTAPLARLTILFQVVRKPSALLLKRDLELSGRGVWLLLLVAFLILLLTSMPMNNTRLSGIRYTVLLAILTISIISFAVSLRVRDLIYSCDGNACRDPVVHFVGGGLAGITAASATYPLDLVRTRLAGPRNTIYYRCIWHTLSTICRDEGFWGFYKGLGATLLVVGPSLAISFSVYETLRSWWQSQRPDDSTVVVSLACGSLSGIASSTATFPLDLVRRRMQLEGAAGWARVYNSGLFGTFWPIIRSEGLRGLYRGIMPKYCKVVPSVGIVFVTYETLKKLLSSEPFN